MQMVQFKCTECDGTVVAELIHIGRGGRCPHCGLPVIVPFVKFRTQVQEDETRAIRSSGVGAVVIGPVQNEAYPEGVRLVSGDVEKRDHVRFPVTGAEVRYSAGESELGPFEVENLSRGGLAFFRPDGESGLELEQDLSLQITVPVFDESIAVVGRIVRLESLADNILGVGTMFVELKDDDFQLIRRLEKATIPGSDSLAASSQP